MIAFSFVICQTIRSLFCNCLIRQSVETQLSTQCYEVTIGTQPHDIWTAGFWHDSLNRLICSWLHPHGKYPGASRLCNGLFWMCRFTFRWECVFEFLFPHIMENIGAWQVLITDRFTVVQTAQMMSVQYFCEWREQLQSLQILSSFASFANIKYFTSK